jgi:NADPH-dependent 2,4-dienoyl-CoA reductase/sulfur reductase-like enzyme
VGEPTRSRARRTVVVVGGGPAGVSAAQSLRRSGVERVVVAEREPALGGVARFSHHVGYGLRDLRRVLSGPEYARRLGHLAARTGAEVWCSTTVTDIGHDLGVTLVGPDGVQRVMADGVVLASGCRERPRSARLVPGDRPEGVLTTGALQRLVGAGLAVGTRAVVVGAELVSFSAVLTLRSVGCAVAAMVTELPRHQGPRGSAVALRVPVRTDVSVVAIRGRGRVESVELSDGSTISCDTVVFTGDWIPEHELARTLGLTLHPTTRGPLADRAGRTSMPGVAAVGNLVHPAETADVCFVGARAAADSIARWVGGDVAWPLPIAVEVSAPLAWAVPRFGRDGLLARVVAMTPRGTSLAATQGETVLWTGRSTRTHVPNRSIRLPGAWLRRVDPAGPPPVLAATDLR